MNKTKQMCADCRNDFYNGKNPLGVSSCWSFKDATPVTRWRTGTFTMPASPGAFTEVVVLDCFHQQGAVFQKSLPSFAIDPVRLARTAKERGRDGVL